MTVNKEKVELNINQKIKVDNWRSSAEKAKGKDRQSTEINSRLDTVRFRIMEIYREMELNIEDITARKIVDKYLGVDTSPKIMLLETQKSSQ